MFNLTLRFLSEGKKAQYERVLRLVCLSLQYSIQFPYSFMHLLFHMHNG